MAGKTEQADSAQEVLFAVKNPGRSSSAPFALRTTTASTVLDLKRQLSREYDGKPDPQVQTIIYAGQVLRSNGMLVRDFLRPKLDDGVPHSLHLVVKANSVSGQSSATQTQQSTSAAPLGYNPTPFQARSTPQGVPGAQPQNADMLQAYQAALNTFVNNRNPQPGSATTAATQPPQQAAGQQATNSSAGALPTAPTGQPQQPQQQHTQQSSQAPGAGHAALYAMQAPPMLAYMPVLIPNPYAALPPGWPSHQQQQPQQQPQQSQQPQHQQGAAGQGHAPMHFPYPPFVPMLFPYGMAAPGAMPGLPPGPVRVHVVGEQHPGVPAAAAPGLRQRHMGAAVGGPAAVLAPAAPGGIFRMRRAPGMQMRMIRIDIKALVQMAVVALVMYQHCPPGRFFMLMGGAALLYLTGLGPLQRALQRLVALAMPTPIRPPQGGQPGAEGQPGAAPQWSLLGELQAVIVGFFSSLIPGWNMNAEDAAAFAAAQQMQAAEAAREAQRAGGGQQNLHQD